MTREIREIVIGAATVLGLVAVLVFMNVREAIVDDSTDHLLVAAKFNKVDGLSEGSEVRLGGIRIGSVTKMVLDDQFRAVVTFSLDPTLNLPKDSSAAIHTDGLFGSKFVVLEPGAAEQSLKSGDEFRLTQDSMVVSDLLELIISEGKIARDKRKSTPKVTPKITVKDAVKDTDS